MRALFRAAVAAAALAAAAGPLTGCCAVARELCSIEAPPTPPRGSRDTPLGAVNYLIDAFGRGAPTEIFESLHPEYRAENGDFSAMQFATAYERFEPEFREDGRRLAGAVKDPPLFRDGDAWVHLRDATGGAGGAGGGADVWLVFRNLPGYVVLVDDDVSQEIRDVLPPLAEVVAVEGDGLVLRQPLPLRGEGEFLDPAKVRRVEIYQDWLLRQVVQPRNIRFVDRMIEETKGDPR